MANDPRFKNTVFATGGKIPIPMSAATVTHIQNVYGGTLMAGARQVSYHLLDETEARSWYHYSGSRSMHLLKADHVFQLKKDMYVIITERTEHTLQSWVQNNANNILNPGTGEPTEELKRILWGVVRGLKHLHTQNLRHGNVTPESVFVVDGIGCLGRPSASKNPLRVDIDIDGFSNVLDFLFSGRAQAGASLQRLMSRVRPLPPNVSNYQVGSRQRHFYMCDCHCTLTSAKEKSMFRHNALLQIKQFGHRRYYQVSLHLRNHPLPRSPWIQNVRAVASAGYNEALVKSIDPAHQNDPTTYSPDPMSFLVYGRNLTEHRGDYNFTHSPEEIEATLESCFPGCMAALLEVMSELSISISIHR